MSTVKFTHNYLVYDEFGLKNVLCMACAKQIKTRAEIRSEIDRNAIIRELSKHADYREIPVILDDKKLAFIMVCDDCKFVNITEMEAKDISEQIRNGLRVQLEYEGKLPDLVEEILKQKNYNVVRKAEVSEVTAALRGI